eukprot:CAMPEP_0202405494 /NCGR_PEP_ID=MMETSP1128-20130828/7160_1 /ASSEMBLY_ACC=CAM_ASM_000463 /TAXON_ID=3047 /ORGANISM="Dunaliella tertiolecta, Strain CCMP1320" /LENGTH=152 /DNA_ID=CAMNT_0049010181 /DNA_START=454 /DNA_END=909 /DNA_ORIENTATION=-
MDTTHLGSGIWSYTLRSAGAILFVSVPATIIQSDWRGEGRKIMPKRSKSYLEAPACIISMAQQARPNVMGQMEPERAQFTTVSSLDTTNSRLLPLTWLGAEEAGAVAGAGLEELELGELAIPRAATNGSKLLHGLVEATCEELVLAVAAACW